MADVNWRAGRHPGYLTSGISLDRPLTVQWSNAVSIVGRAACVRFFEFQRRRQSPINSNPFRAMRKALYAVCHRLNGCVIVGVALVTVANQPSPPRLSKIKVPDILVDAMWQGCRSEGIKRFKAHIIGKGWQVP